MRDLCGAPLGSLDGDVLCKQTDGWLDWVMVAISATLPGSLDRRVEQVLMPSPGFVSAAKFAVEMGILKRLL